MFIKLVEFLGIISKAVVSSTNFVLKFQSTRSSLVITENNITPNLVPCGIPPFGDFQSDNTPAIRVAYILFERKADTQLLRTGCILSF